MSEVRSQVYSMTGFGSAELEILESGRNQSYKFEIKSLNHRNLDVKIRVPKEWMALEPLIRKTIQTKIQRGSIEFKIEQKDAAAGAASEKASVDWSLNLPQIQSYAQGLEKLSGSKPTPEAYASLLSLPDSLKRSSELVDEEALWKKVEPALREAIDSLHLMRAKEGEALKAVLLQASNDLSANVKILRTKRTENVGSLKSKIREKITRLLETYPIADPGNLLESRLAQELAMIADRTDIEEELARLEGHLEHFSSTFKEGGLLGRKLEFLLQEMQREFNTTANKAQDLNASDVVIQSKLKLEQIREQVMNLE